MKVCIKISVGWIRPRNGCTSVKKVISLGSDDLSEILLVDWNRL